ncbi:hypothetical protein BHM03_00020059 [Ensete ventricosum]|nr:hypothetical protein BHM03_00020059 [Ensete ventricosum]
MSSMCQRLVRLLPTTSSGSSPHQSLVAYVVVVLPCRSPRYYTRFCFLLYCCSNHTLFPPLQLLLPRAPPSSALLYRYVVVAAFHCNAQPSYCCCSQANGLSANLGDAAPNCAINVVLASLFPPPLLSFPRSLLPAYSHISRTRCPYYRHLCRPSTPWRRCSQPRNQHCRCFPLPSSGANAQLCRHYRPLLPSPTSIALLLLLLAIVTTSCSNHFLPFLVVAGFPANKSPPLGDLGDATPNRATTAATFLLHRHHLYLLAVAQPPSLSLPSPFL